MKRKIIAIAVFTALHIFGAQSQQPVVLFDPTVIIQHLHDDFQQFHKYCQRLLCEERKPIIKQCDQIAYTMGLADDVLGSGYQWSRLLVPFQGQVLQHCETSMTRVDAALTGLMKAAKNFSSFASFAQSAIKKWQEESKNPVLYLGFFPTASIDWSDTDVMEAGVVLCVYADNALRVLEANNILEPGAFQTVFETMESCLAELLCFVQDYSKGKMGVVSTMCAWIEDLKENLTLGIGTTVRKHDSERALAGFVLQNLNKQKKELLKECMVGDARLATLVKDARSQDLHSDYVMQNSANFPLGMSKFQGVLNIREGIKHVENTRKSCLRASDQMSALLKQSETNAAAVLIYLRVKKDLFFDVLQYSVDSDYLRAFHDSLLL